MKKLLLVPVLALALGTAACGGDSKDKASSTPPPSAPQPTASAPPPPTTAPPAGQGNGAGTGQGNGGNAAQKRAQQTMAKTADCMRKKGYDMPDPKPGQVITAPRNIQGKDPNKVNQDTQECVKKANSSTPYDPF
ncbi:hypothetical protein ACFVH6_22960 [Spirillospora sp. NPDC127200]